MSSLNGKTERAMTKVHVTNQLPGNARLWRYLSLDRLIDLLSASELFFAPLATFAKSDPFEGYLPTVALDAYASIFRKGVTDSEHTRRVVEEHRNRQGFPLTDAERGALEASLEMLRTQPRQIFAAISKATTVNCWHASEIESEAMWRLYSENGKAVAVETDLDALKVSIEERETPHSVRIYPIKYLDFYDTQIQPRDCLVEGHLVPLLKRISYQHEREVRAFITKVGPTPREGANVEFWKPEPVRLPINVKAMVKAVHISPYAVAPFPTSVVRVCEAFGLDPEIVKLSPLLSGHEELLDRLSL